jgi:PAS domain S-box-containing protein
MSTSDWVEYVSRLSSKSPARPVIVESWARSRAAALRREREDMELTRVPEVDLQQRLVRNGALMKAAEPHLKWLTTTYAAIRHVAYITDVDGVVLYAVGDPEFQRTFGLTPGYDWSEKAMGTNGAGTALTSNRPVAVVGSEHYLSAFENCTCTGAPIHDAHGAVIGAIDFSTSVADGDPERLPLIAHIAFTIERELRHEDELRERELYRTLTDKLRKQQTELELANNRLQLLLDHVPTIIYLVDENGRFLNVNRQWETQLGLSHERVIGKSLYDLFPRETADQFAANNRTVLKSGPTQFEEVYVDGGATRTYLSLKVPVHDARGRAYAICGLSTDITERKRTEEELRATQAALEEADRRKNEFIAMISHELRNPLAPIKYGVHVIETVAPEHPALRKAADVISRQVDYLTRLLNDLLDVSRIVHGRIDLKRERTDFVAAVNAAVESVRSFLDARGQHLHVNAPTRAVYVSGDSLRLVQIVLNLLHNASKFTPHEGRIAVNLTEDGGTAMLTVRDSGIGMSDEVLRELFQPFKQAGPPGAGGGLGLGLYLVKQLAELQGGTVSASSGGPGKGSEFTLRVPVLQENGTTA